MLKTKDNGTVLVMKLTEIADKYAWCQELLGESKDLNSLIIS